MRLMFFAFRNLARNKRRTTAIVGVVALGTAALLLAGGYAAASFSGLREQTIRNGLGHLQVWPETVAGQDQPALASGIANVDALRQAIEANPRVAAVTARVEFTGLASNGDRTIAVIGRGIEPTYEFARARFLPRMLQGRPIAAGAATEAIVAEGLARSLDVEPGKRVTLLSTTLDGAINGIDAEVVGIYTTGVRELDDRSIVVGLEAAQILLNAQRVSKLVVLLHRASDTVEVRDELRGALTNADPALQIRTWSELATFYHQVRGLYSGIFGFLGLIIAGLVVLSAGNAMTMTVMERVREIGTLRALGTGRLRVMAMFVTEGLGLGIAGGSIGLAAAAALATLLSRARITMPPPPTFTTGVPLQIDVVGTLYVAVLGAMVAIVALAAVLPAARAARLRITDALGHI